MLDPFQRFSFCLGQAAAEISPAQFRDKLYPARRATRSFDDYVPESPALGLRMNAPFKLIRSFSKSAAAEIV